MFDFTALNNLSSELQSQVTGEKMRQYAKLLIDLANERRTEASNANVLKMQYEKTYKERVQQLIIEGNPVNKSENKADTELYNDKVAYKNAEDTADKYKALCHAHENFMWICKIELENQKTADSIVNTNSNDAVKFNDDLPF